MTYILGVNSFHADASAALIKDGKIILAAEEERFNRIKHSAGFPENAIKWCIEESGISIKDLSHIAINTSPKANFFKKLFFTLKNKPSPIFILEKTKTKFKRTSYKSKLKELFDELNFNAQVHFIEHHKAHMASAFYASPFKSSAVLSVDGFGDFASTAWGYGINNTLGIDEQVIFPHSLGIFYTAITQYLGFPNYGDEYKVMGLAPYGDNKFEEEISELIFLKNNGKFELNLNYFSHTKKWKAQQWDHGIPIIENQYSNEIVQLLGKQRVKDEPISQRHKDIAFSAQKQYEKTLFHILNNLYSKYNSENIALAGGCAANSVANGKITKKTPFKNVYVQAAAGDAGGAIGAALEVWHKTGNKRSKKMGPAYLGPRTNHDQLKKLLEIDHIKKRFTSKEFDLIEYKSDDISQKNLLEKVTNEIMDGKVIGWFQGRMEWGPRALGNRSIIADPRRNDMKKILNSKIKKRESFRPFAPSILKEEISNWFILKDELDSNVPYMMKVYPIKKDKMSLIPSVCHVDGTGRLQSVTKDQNPKYYDLIKTFFKKTGVPILLNTSFNENEPIVCNPNEALDCFLRTKMDVLVMENFLIIRN